MDHIIDLQVVKLAWNICVNGVEDPLFSCFSKRSICCQTFDGLVLKLLARLESACH